MLIGSTSLPTAIPTIVESKNDDELEIDQPLNTDKEMEDPSPSVKEQMTIDENTTDNTARASATEDQMDTDQTNGRNHCGMRTKWICF